MEGNGTFVKVFLIVFFSIFIIAWVGPFLPIILPFLKALNPIWYLVVAIVIFVIWIASTYNKFVHLAQKVNQSAGTIDVYLKQRFDLIPNLVETVKGYAKYEENILEKIAELRTEFANNNNQDMGLSAELNNRYNQLLAVVENYPTITASEQYTSLMDSIEGAANRILVAREDYNVAVSTYNRTIRHFPGNILANMFGFEEMEEFKADEAANNSSVVDFGD